jgi:hypothetical protein
MFFLGLMWCSPQYFRKARSRKALFLGTFGVERLSALGMPDKTMRRQESAAPAASIRHWGCRRSPARPRSGSHRPPWRIRRRCRGCPKARRQNKKKPESATHRRIKYPSLGAVNRSAKKRFAEPFAILENAASSVRSNIIDMADVLGIKIVRCVQEDDKAASE